MAQHPRPNQGLNDTGEAIITGTLGSVNRLDRALVAALEASEQEAPPLSRARLQALIAAGAVTLAGSVVTSPATRTTAGTSFAIRVPAPAPATAAPQDIALTIVYEDDALIVVDKPAGMVVHPAAGNHDGTLVNALLHHAQGQATPGLSGINGVLRPGIVHRIDKDTSGLLVVARHDAAHARLARQFAAHSIERAYLAITAGVPTPHAGTLRGVIGRAAQDRKKMALLPPADATRRGKPAVTHYRTLEALGADAALVECRLETGRTHQVRVHMAAIGHGLLGDPLYGRSRLPLSLKAVLAEHGFARQALHAAVLGFIHPITGVAMRFTSALPADMAALLTDLRAPNHG